MPRSSIESTKPNQAKRSFKATASVCPGESDLRERFITSPNLTAREREIRPNDVLNGRGKSYLQYPGNKEYCSFVDERVEEYSTLSCDHEKRAIQLEIMNLIESSGGRFIKENINGKGWSLVPFKEKRQKVAHALQHRVRKMKAEVKKASQNTTSPQPTPPADHRIPSPFASEFQSVAEAPSPFTAPWEVLRESPVAVSPIPTEVFLFDPFDAGFLIASVAKESESDIDSLSFADIPSPFTAHWEVLREPPVAVSPIPAEIFHLDPFDAGLLNPSVAKVSEPDIDSLSFGSIW